MVGPRILSISPPGGVKLLRDWYGTQEPVRFQRDRFQRFVEEALPQRADDPRNSGGRTGRAGRDVASASSSHGFGARVVLAIADSVEPRNISQARPRGTRLTFLSVSPARARILLSVGF